MSAFATDDGLVLVDTGRRSSPARRARAGCARWSDAPLHTAVYTHGHIDHVFGVERYEAEARRHGLAGARASSPTRRCPHRFDRYIAHRRVQRA